MLQSSITEHCGFCHRLMSLNDIYLSDMDEWVCKDEMECAGAAGRHLAHTLTQKHMTDKEQPK